ncbi:MAG: adenine phosphoribosyltransferase [Candidatus Shapirobacteria bacterium]
MNFKSKIRNIPDFPEKGIVFRDICPLLEDKVIFKAAVDELVRRIGKNKIDKVIGIDARGFILAGVLAHRLKAGLVLVRKKGKLPYKTVEEEYNLEYGKAALAIHQDSIKKGERVLLADDVLATGGTMRAAASLVEKLGGKIAMIVFLTILDYLPGQKILADYKLISLVNYRK